MSSRDKIPADVKRQSEIVRELSTAWASLRNAELAAIASGRRGTARHIHEHLLPELRFLVSLYKGDEPVTAKATEELRADSPAHGA